MGGRPSFSFHVDWDRGNEIEWTKTSKRTDWRAVLLAVDGCSLIAIAIAITTHFVHPVKHHTYMHPITSLHRYLLLLLFPLVEGQVCTEKDS